LGLGIPVARITERLGLSRTRWSQIENDHNMIAAAMIPALAELFELDDEELHDLEALRAAGGDRRQAWWLDYDDMLDDRFVRYCGLEHGASSLRTFNATVINGLLQTEEYAAALIANSPHVSELDRRKMLDVRLKRQQRFVDEPRLKVHAIVYEAALLGDLGSPGMLVRQLYHVADQIEELNQVLEVRVLPFSSRPSGLTGAGILILLDFARPELRTVVWEEHLRGNLRDDSDDLADFLSLIYGQTIERCLDREKSLEMILRRARTIESQS
jgi:transcriptional regulator with XRE-family HTH domain